MSDDKEPFVVTALVTDLLPIVTRLNEMPDLSADESIIAGLQSTGPFTISGEWMPTDILPFAPTPSIAPMPVVLNDRRRARRLARRAGVKFGTFQWNTQRLYIVPMSDLNNKRRIVIDTDDGRRVTTPRQLRAYLKAATA